MGKSALSSSSPRAEKQGRAAYAGGLRARGRPGSWGKWSGSRGGSIPPLNLGGGGLWRRGHVGGRRPALVLAVATLWGSTTAGVRGERERESRWVDSPT